MGETPAETPRSFGEKSEKVKRVRFARSASEPPTRGSSQSESMSRDPKTLCLKGFTCAYCKSDLKVAAIDVLKCLGIPDTDIVDYHSGAFQESIVVYKLTLNALSFIGIGRL